MGRALGAPFTALLELPVGELIAYSEIAREHGESSKGTTILARGDA